MQTVSDFFGCHVFSEAVMKQKLPKAVFKDVYAAIHEGKRLDLAAANVVVKPQDLVAACAEAQHAVRADQRNIRAQRPQRSERPHADAGQARRADLSAYCRCLRAAA